MRPSAALATAVTAVLTAGLALVPVASAAGAAAPAAAGPGGYVPVDPTRIVDTRSGVYGNHRGAIGAGKVVAVDVTGADGVPSDAAAVALSVSVVAATGSGVVTASTYGVKHRPAVATVSFRAGQGVGDLAIVPVTSGRIDLWNASGGTVQLTVDVSGYYVGGTARADAAFHAVTPTRVADTRTGVNRSHKGAVKAGAGVSPHITGLAGVPRGAGAVAATITAFGNKTNGTVSARAYGGDDHGSSVEQVLPGRATSQLVVLPLSPSGQITVVNHAKDAVNLAVDVSGYFAAGSAATAYTTQAVESGSGQTLHQTATIGAKKTAHVAVGGIPRTGVAAAIVTVHVLAASAAGTIKGSAATAPTVVQFTTGATRSGVEIAPVSNSSVTLTNASNRATKVQVDVLAYVPSGDAPAATGTSAARYLDDLTGSESHDLAAMRSHGTADAQTGARLVLLDVGAQSITAPLSASKPGVVPALTDTRVTLTYGELVDDVVAYLDAFGTESGGTATTVAVGTNTSGAFDPSDPNYYTPRARGAAWANDVVDVLRAAAPTGITVLGADDIEAGFGDVDSSSKLRDGATESQALAWENAYLAATPADLVYNGDAEGCPRTLGLTGYTCTPGWTQTEYFKLAYNGGRVRVLPQIAYGYEAAKWADIDQGGNGGANGGKLDFLGSLTDHAAAPSHLTAARAHTALYRALSTIKDTPTLVYAADISR